MGLKESKVSNKISRDAKLWRYMTLDKLINLLSTKKLFFTPLNSYAETDPFEGLLPKVALDSIKCLYLAGQKSLEENLHSVYQYSLRKNEGKPLSPLQIDVLDKAVKMIKNQPLLMEKVHFRIFKSTLVNCWHQNEYESEAMWRLYSENNKGIVIQTTLQNLVESLDDERIFLSEVKYINFNDEMLKPSDCVVNGHISPLLKRKSFEHENEVRLFFQPDRDLAILSADEYHYPYELIDVDLSKLISKIYISPYAKEPYISSVIEMVKIFGINESKVVYSNLLKPDENLTRIF